MKSGKTLGGVGAVGDASDLNIREAELWMQGDQKILHGDLFDDELELQVRASIPALSGSTLTPLTSLENEADEMGSNCRASLTHISLPLSFVALLARLGSYCRLQHNSKIISVGSPKPSC